MIYIGIDPGLSGAVGIIHDHRAEVYKKTVEGVGSFDPPAGMGCAIEQVFVYDTPTVLVEGDKTRRKYLTTAMALLLKPFADRQDVLVVLESVHSMPKQGVSSSFTFGQGLGMWQGIIAAYNMPLEMPSPQRWKKEIMADQGKEKSAARFKAAQLFPNLAAQFSRVKDDGRAEALLMAEYGRRLRKGQ